MVITKGELFDMLCNLNDDVIVYINCKSCSEKHGDPIWYYIDDLVIPTRQANKFGQVVLTLNISNGRNK